MSRQNIYDNDIFFSNYKKIRDNEKNANILFEKPALFSLLPDLNEKVILDLGCGYGENCIEFVKRGRIKVIGIDISKKMLEVAIKENSHKNIIYKNIPMEELHELDNKFDIVISSLAVHYVEDFKELSNNIYNLLNDGGVFIFSQENPLNTCFTKGERWTRDEKGNKIFANISNYSIDGERESVWFVDNVKKYHRKFSTILNSLIESGFTIEKLIEPIPSKEILEKYPEYEELNHKPYFLIVKVKKL